MAMGTLWLPIEAFEGLSNQDVHVPYSIFLSSSFILSILIFLADGYLISGFLKRKITVLSNSFDTTITVRFGDIFSHKGWTAISVNDFFDSIVDDDLVSRQSSHGAVISQFWHGDSHRWERQVHDDLENLEYEYVPRNRGNRKEYSIGTTARASASHHDFLFVALSQTNIDDNVTRARVEDLMVAVRGLLVKGRAVCANKPLIIPLLGSGLSRVGIKSELLVDLILAVAFEETKLSKITDSIVIVLPMDRRTEIDLRAISGSVSV